jgi:hypothetical protein
LRSARRAVYDHVALVEVPPTRPDDERRRLARERVVLAVGSAQLDRLLDGVDDIHLPVEDVVPGGRGRILEIRHEHVGAGVESVDGHLSFGGSGYLHPAIDEAGSGIGDTPLRISNLRGGREKIGLLACVQTGLTSRARVEQLGAPGTKRAFEVGHEPDRLGRQDLRSPSAGRAGDVDPFDAHREPIGFGDTSATLRRMYDDDDFDDLDARRRPLFKIVVLIVIVGLIAFIAPLFFDLVLG